MRRALFLVLAMLAISATSALPASGQSGHNLFWSHCYADGGATETLFDCSTNEDSGVLVVSVILPANLPQFAAVSLTIDVWVAGGSLPPWWQLAAGQCRANALVVNFDPTSFSSTENCPPIWADTVPQQIYQVQSGYRGPDTFRLSAVAAVPAGQELSLLADGTELTVCQIEIKHTKTLGADACEGCPSGACFWLNETSLLQPGIAGVYVSYPAVNAWTTHNASAKYYSEGGVQCATPALNRSWGAIKGMFR